MLAAMHALAALGETPDGTTLSTLLVPFTRYVSSGEINTTVSDAKAVAANIEKIFTARGAQFDRLDGLTVTGPNWWFNVRASNTEPLLRLNVEGDDVAAMELIRDEVLALMKDEN